MISDAEKKLMKKFRLQLGKYLRSLREERRLSVIDVAEGTDMSDPYLYQVESGIKALTDPIKIQKLAEFFEVPVENILRKAGYLPDNDPYKELNDKYAMAIEKLKSINFEMPFSGIIATKQKKFIVDHYEDIIKKYNRENQKGSNK